MFNSLNNKPEDVTRALVETAKLAEKLKAKKEAEAKSLSDFFEKNKSLWDRLENIDEVEYDDEDCGKCYGCATMRSTCTGEV